jgi:hypothetical protein
MEGRKRPWGRLIGDVEQEAQVRSRTVSTGARLAATTRRSRVFSTDWPWNPGIGTPYIGIVVCAPWSGDMTMYPTCGASISSVVGLRGLVKAVSSFFRSRIWMTPSPPVP